MRSTAQHKAKWVGQGQAGARWDLYSLCDIIMGFESNQQAKEFIYFDDSFWEIYKAAFLPALTDIENVSERDGERTWAFWEVWISVVVQRRPVVVITGVVGSYLM